VQIVSAAFRDGAAIPPQYTCKGQNVSPPLNFVNVPNGAQSLALIMHDPDAPAGDYVHWTIWDIPTSTDTIAANSVPVGSIQGLNSGNSNKYIGPCPPAGTGTHRYIFELYALDTSLGLSADTKRDDLLKAIKGHVIEQRSLTGFFSAL
jgi:Raf kinase inhibitor-like YbhB/YbcL family protein